MDNPELEFQDADFRQDSFGVSTLFKTYLNPSTQLDLEASYNSFTDEGIEDTFEETSDNLVNREDNDADDVEWSVAASITRQMNGVADAIGIDGAELKVGLVAKSKDRDYRSEEHTSELQSLMRISYAVFCLKKKNKIRRPP